MKKFADYFENKTHICVSLEVCIDKVLAQAPY